MSYFSNRVPLGIGTIYSRERYNSAPRNAEKRSNICGNLYSEGLIVLIFHIDFNKSELVMKRQGSDVCLRT